MVPLHAQSDRACRFCSCMSTLPQLCCDTCRALLRPSGYSRANSPPISVSIETMKIFADHYPVSPRLALMSCP